MTTNSGLDGRKQHRIPIGLFALTSVAELLGCYLPYLRRDQSGWLLPPGAFSLAAFAWLLTSIHLRPAGSMPQMAAPTWPLRCCGSGWWTVSPRTCGISSAWQLSLTGMAIIAFAPRG